MNILLSNDDGYLSEGIRAVALELQAEHNCTIVAPDSQRSACSHSLTMFQPLTLKKEVLPQINGAVYSCSGTPADCIKLALFEIFKDKKPDLIISGINAGANLGTDCIYSGTVAAAMEGMISGIPAISLSLSVFKSVVPMHYVTAISALKKALAIENVFSHLKNAMLNINAPNVPLNEIQGYKWAPLGLVNYQDTYDIEGNSYILKTGKLLERVCDDASDICLHMENYITYTLIHWDITAHNYMLQMKDIE